MGVESATYINDLDSALPAGGDAVSQGDDHLRLLKAVAKATLPDASRPYRLPAMSLLTADRTISDTATAQNIFGASEDVLTLAANTTYEVEGMIIIDRSAGTTAHTFGFLFDAAGTATFTSLALLLDTTVSVSASYATLISSAATAVLTQILKTAAALTTVTPSNNADETIRMKIKGLIRTNGAGTLIPQIKYSAAPGGAPTIRQNSFFRVHPLGADTIASVGAWA